MFQIRANTADRVLKSLMVIGASVHLTMREKTVSFLLVRQHNPPGYEPR